MTYPIFKSRSLNKWISTEELFYTSVLIHVKEQASTVSERFTFGRSGVFPPSVSAITCPANSRVRAQRVQPTAHIEVRGPCHLHGRLARGCRVLAPACSALTA